MRFYGEGFFDVLKMPMRAFWIIYKNIDVLQAEEDLQTLSIPSPEHSKEIKEKFIKKALETRGEPIVYEKEEETLDRVGLQELKRLM